MVGCGLSDHEVTMDFEDSPLESMLVKLQIKADRRDLAARNEVVRRIKTAFPVTSPTVVTVEDVSTRLGVGADVCERVFAELVREGVIRRHGHATYSPVHRREAIRYRRQATAPTRSSSSRIAS
jgi:hypothetical protein